jgi:hypothetical protein
MFGGHRADSCPKARRETRRRRRPYAPGAVPRVPTTRAELVTGEIVVPLDRRRTRPHYSPSYSMSSGRDRLVLQQPSWTRRLRPTRTSKRKGARRSERPFPNQPSAPPRGRLGTPPWGGLYRKRSNVLEVRKLDLMSGPSSDYGVVPQSM